jgi:hypothetical protein
MNLDLLGKWLLIFGLGLVLLGGLIWLSGRFFPGLSRLPGTLKFEVGGLTCIIPILASIILSVVLTILLNLVVRFLNK